MSSRSRPARLPRTLLPSMRYGWGEPFQPIAVPKTCQRRFASRSSSAVGQFDVIGIGRSGRPSPSRQTGQADFPQPVSLWVVLPPRGLTDRSWSDAERAPRFDPDIQGRPGLPQRDRQHRQGSRPSLRGQSRRRRWFRPALTEGTRTAVASFDFPVRHLPCRGPFAPWPLRHFFARMGALTPAHLNLGR